MIKSKSGLAIVLSKLKVFENPSQYREQYTTDSETAASVLWHAYMKGDIKGRIIADLGAGTGILGIGAFLLGAKRVFLVELDEKAVEIIDKNIDFIIDYFERNKNKKIINKIKIINDDIINFNENVDVVIQNPPFGVQNMHADKVFLEKAFEIGKVIYIIHKIESGNFIEKISSENNFKITEIMDFELPIKQTMKHHKKRIHRFEAGCWRMERL